MSANWNYLIGLSALAFFALTLCGQQTGCLADLVNITDGTSTFTWDTDTGVSSISSVHGNYSTTFEPMIRYRNSADGLQTRSTANFEGSGSQRAIVSNSVQNIGSVGLVTVDYGTIDGGNPLVNDLQLTIALVIGTNDFGGTLTYAMELENIGATSVTDVEMFQYYDWDIGGVSDNTGSRWATSELDGIVQQGARPEETIFHGTADFENWEIGEWDTIQAKLLDNGDLTNSGTPFGPGDMTAAFGWDVGTIDTGQIKNVRLVMEGISAIPEPSHTILLGIGLLAGIGYRRRSKI